MDHAELKEDIDRLQRSLDRIYEYLQHLPVLEPVSGDLACLEDLLSKWRRDDGGEL